MAEPINNCTILPPLPTGLSIDPINMSLFPEHQVLLLTPTIYTVQAHNIAGASAGASVTLKVNPGVPLLSYDGASGTNGSIGGAMSVSPTALTNRGSAITGCSSTPGLPTWATLNPLTCVITGTPTEDLPTTTYYYNRDQHCR